MEEFIFHEHPSDPVGVRKILSQDMVYRKRRKWPLVKLEDFTKFEINFSRSKQQILAYVTNSNDYQYDYHDKKLFETPFESVSTIIGNLKQFDHLKTLLGPKGKYNGKLAVCGAYFSRMLVNYNLRSSRQSKEFCGKHGEKRFFLGLTDEKLTTFNDLDIYFYATKEKEGENILKDCIKLLMISATNNKEIVNVTIERSLHNTKVNLYNRTTHCSYGYRFIHKSFPTFDSILGNFNFGPHMVGYDGINIFGTPLGVWSNMKRTIIFDKTRNDTTLEYYMYHYVKNFEFRLVFPGLLFTNEIYKKMDALTRVISEEDHGNLLGKMGKEFTFSSDFAIVKGVRTYTITHMKHTVLRFNYFKLCAAIYEDNKPKDEGYPKTGYYIEKRKFNLGSKLNYEITQDILDEICEYISINPYKQTDYHNFSMLHCNKFDKVVASETFLRNNQTPISLDGMDSKTMDKIIYNIIENPDIKVGNNHYEKFSKIIKHFYTKYDFKTSIFEDNYEWADYDNNSGIYRNRRYNGEDRDKELIRLLSSNEKGIGLFAEFLTVFRELKTEEQYKNDINDIAHEVLQTLEARVFKNIELYTVLLKDIKWSEIDRSFNKLKPIDIYLTHYTPFIIGLNVKIEILLKLLRKHNSCFKLLNTDLINLICGKLITKMK